MKTVFVPSQFYTLEDLRGTHQQPDVVAEDLQEIYKNFHRITTTKLKSHSR
jgi:hypothetical protein